MSAALVLTAAPALLLFALLLAGVRPGEAALVRLVRRRRLAPSRAPVRLPSPRLALVARFTSCLLATEAAGRAPPR